VGSRTSSSRAVPPPLYKACAPAGIIRPSPGLDRVAAGAFVEYHRSPMNTGSIFRAVRRLRAGCPPFRAKRYGFSGNCRRACRTALALIVLVNLSVRVTPRAEADPESTPTFPRLTWLGRSTFLIATPSGTRVLMDPTPAWAGGKMPEDLEVDLVTISHENADSSYVRAVTGSPRVIRGLTKDRKGWLKTEATFRDVAVRSVGVYHDDQEGRQRGLNTIFIVETAGIRIAHMGDLGHRLTEWQISRLGSIDVLLIPVGGGTTVDADSASHVVDQLRPRLLVIPMNYRVGEDPEDERQDVAAFVAGRPHVRRVAGDTLEIQAVKTRPGAEVVILQLEDEGEPSAEE